MKWFNFFLLLLVVSLQAFSAHAEPTLKAKSDTIFSRPHDITLSPDGRFLYVADLGNNEIKVLDPESLKVLGAFGQKELSDPHDVTFDEKGRLLVADTGHGRIAIFEVKADKGRFVSEITEKLSSPEGVAVGLKGTIAVVDTGSHRFVVYRKGEPPLVVGKYGSGPAEFKRPHDLAFDGQGRLFVTDPGNDRIQIFDQQLGFVMQLKGKPFGFNQPKYLHIASGQNLLVADQHNNRIVAFHPDFAVAFDLPTAKMKAAGLHFDLPEGVVSRGEFVWVSDTYNHRILRFQTSRMKK